MKLSKKVYKLYPEGAFEVLAETQKLERQRKKIIHFEIGQPDFPTPKRISNIAVKAIQEGKTRYTPSLGIFSLRKIIADSVSKFTGISTSYKEVAVTPGCKTALFVAIASIVDKGDEVICPDPGFPAYKILIEFFGGKPIRMPLLEEKSFSFDMDIFRKKMSKKTKAIILNYPGNPTGTIIPKRDLEEIASLAKRYKCWVITDEIYNKILYTKEPYVSIYSLHAMKKQTIIVDGFSKTYSMTGWRLGYLVAPEEIMDRFDYFLTHLVACTATFTQEAGVEALSGKQNDVHKMVKEFKKRRDFIVEKLNQIRGVTCVLPQGAFYAFPNIKSYKKTSMEIANYLLNDSGVALLSGTYFGKYGEGYLRISYATDMETLASGLKKIKKSLEKLL